MDRFQFRMGFLILFLALVTLFAVRVQAAEIDVRGLMDVAAQSSEDQRYLNQLITGDSATDALRTRLFLSGSEGPTQVHVQFVLSSEARDEIRIHGAYLLHRIFDEREIYVEAGLIPVHDGTWAPRTYSNKNPLIGMPLGYYYKSTLPYRQMPVDLDDLVSHKGEGQLGVNYADGSDDRGVPWATAPILYENCWNNGIYLRGKQGPIEFALGATVGAPSSPWRKSDLNDDISPHAKLGWAPMEELILHVSWARGAYLYNDVDPYLPAGKSVNDYKQELWGFSAQVSRGRFIVNGEIFFNQYDTPLRDEGLRNQSYYVEGLSKLWAGSYFALRFDDIRFEEVETTTETTSWDQNIQRIEAGFGYAVTRRLKLKAGAQLYNLGDGFADEKLIPMAQASVQF